MLLLQLLQEAGCPMFFFNIEYIQKSGSKAPRNAESLVVLIFGEFSAETARKPRSLGPANSFIFRRSVCKDALGHARTQADASFTTYFT